MDQKLLVKGLQALSHELDQRYGPVSLLMFLALVPGIKDYWNLVVSAQGLDQADRATAIGLVVDLLTETMPREIWPSIGRVSVLRTDDPFVKGIDKIKRKNQALAEEDSALYLEALSVSGIEIPEAIVLQQPKAA
ncbi:MAG: hypothetical protein JF614_17305 [Acidobacteria bacterium]|nr:hypothetical protein [Acidobacteriota bacterium]